MEAPGSVAGWGTKIPQAVQYGQKKKKKKNVPKAYCLLKLSEDSIHLAHGLISGT